MIDRIPDPDVILSRYVAVTGVTEISLDNYSPAAVTGYGMVPMDLSQTGVLVHDGTPRAFAPISFYNPATKTWDFPPEYVQSEERAPLAELAQEKLYPMALGMLPVMVATGHTLLNPQSPVTQSVRKEIADIVEPLEPCEWLKRSGVVAQLEGNGKEPGGFVAVDDFTTISAAQHTLEGELSYREPVGINDSFTMRREFSIENGKLAVVYFGVRVETDGHPGGIVRSTRGLLVGYRDPYNPTRWLPNLEAITKREWDVLRRLPELFRRTKANHPNFHEPYCGDVFTKDNI